MLGKNSKCLSPYLWRCEEYRGLAQIAHGVELGPEKSSESASLAIVGCCVPRVSAIFYPSSKVYRDQPEPRADKNYCTFSRTSIFGFSPVEGFVIHLVQSSFPARSHPPLCRSSFLVAELSLGSFVAEDLHLTVAAVGRPVHDVGSRVVEGVDLDVQGEPLHPLLGAEVGGETLHRQVHLRRRLQRVPVNRPEQSQL